MKKICNIIVVMLFAIVSVKVSIAGEPPNITISLDINESVYLLHDDPIMVDLSIENLDADVITSRGFKEKVFSQYLFFVNPNNTVGTAYQSGAGLYEPGLPPRVWVGRNFIQVDFVEIIEAGWLYAEDPFDAHEFYPLNVPGHYSVKAVLTMSTYNGVPLTDDDINYYLPLGSASWSGMIESNTVEFDIVADADGDGYSWPVADPRLSLSDKPDCDDQNPEINPGAEEIAGDGLDNDCNAETTDLVANATVVLDSFKHTVGGGSYPESGKSPLQNMKVRLYDRSDGSCVKNNGVSWQHYQAVWEACYPFRMTKTDQDGSAVFEVEPGEYLALGEYEAGLYIGINVGLVEPGQIIKKFLKLIEKVDGKKVPAKYTRRTGSELLIIEPEYIEWSGVEELYPFIFESLGDWQVTTSVSPPEGFVADNESLSESVNTETEVIQFKITDIGSDWVATGIVHDIGHKGKKEKIKSKVGVKLTKKLAKKKGLTELGEKIKK